MSITTIRTAESPLTEAGADALHAAWESWRIASASNEEGVYEAAHRNVRMVLDAAYGVDAAEVLDVMLDSFEVPTYCARVVAERRREAERADARTAFEDAAWNEIVDSIRPALPAPLDMDDAYAVANALVAESAAAWDAYRRTDMVIDWHGDYTFPITSLDPGESLNPVCVALTADVVAA